MVHILDNKGKRFLCGSPIDMDINKFSVLLSHTNNWVPPKPTCETCILLHWANPSKTYRTPNIQKSENQIFFGYLFKWDALNQK